MPRIWTASDAADIDYGVADEAIAWMDGPDCPGPTLLPWQRFLMREALARRGDAWAYPTVILRVSRQQGKTTALRSLLAWFLLRGRDVLGEPQRILSTHFDGKQAVELMVPVANAMGYGQGFGGRKFLDRQTFMALWYPGGRVADDEPVWIARAMTMSALTGNRGLTVTFVDELQDAKRRQVQEALGGSLSSARVRNRQRWYAGTGEKPESDLLRQMRGLLGAPGVLWAEWSVPPDADEDDPAVWEWASPDWSEGRLAYLREQAVELPRREFAANYLLSDGAAEVEGLVDRRVWAGLEAAPVPWSGVGVEAAPGRLPVVVGAGAAADGRLVLSARQAGSMAEAVGWCRDAGVQPRVGKSLLHDPGWLEVGAVPASGTSAALCGTFLQLVADGVVAHDGGGVLSGQVVGSRVVQSGSGLRVAGGRVDAVKAAVWAVEAARTRPEAPMIW